MKPQTSVSLHPLLKQAGDPVEEILTFDKQKEGGTEVERLREENKRLKRTLVERFDQTFTGSSNHQ